MGARALTIHKAQGQTIGPSPDLQIPRVLLSFATSHDGPALKGFQDSPCQAYVGLTRATCIEAMCLHPGCSKKDWMKLGHTDAFKNLLYADNRLERMAAEWKVDNADVWVEAAHRLGL